mgnify:CR=1 FL=1
MNLFYTSSFNKDSTRYFSGVVNWYRNCNVSIKAQDILPFVENFSKSKYEGDNQVWSVTQGNDNALYFANNHYFVRYNG